MLFAGQIFYLSNKSGHMRHDRTFGRHGITRPNGFRDLSMLEV